VRLDRAVVSGQALHGAEAKDMTKHFNDLRSRALAALHREDGQSLVEYGLILLLVALVAIAGLTILGNDVAAMLDEIGKQI
jgi:Flp pilus assembly pilin Flp